MRLISTIFLGALLATTQQRTDGELTSSPVRGSVHVLVMPAAGNVGVSAGPDGAFIIDDQFVTTIFMSEQGGS